MITDLPVVSARRLPAIRWQPGVVLGDDDARAGDTRHDVVRVQCGTDDLPALAAALTVHGPRVRLELAPGRWPDVVDVGALVGGGVVECSIAAPGTASGREWVHLVAFLVAAREHGLAPEWILPPARPGWVTAAMLNHLTPPVRADDPATNLDDTADVARWAAVHRFGTLYWRHGPGFASVVDNRDGDTARYLIDDPCLLAVFGALAHPVDLDAPVVGRGGADSVQAPPRVDRSAVEDLLDAGLAVCSDGWATRLPYRLRHRPMPGSQL